jgi:hypothetical protein
MLETGFVVALGLVVWWSNCGWGTRLWLLSHSLVVDIAIFTFLTAVHWGTFSGVMAATVGALVASVLLKCARAVYGFRKNGKYVPGAISIEHLIKR